MKMFKQILPLIIVVSMATLISCSKSDPAPTALTATTFTNLPADPPSGGYNPTNGQAIGVTKKFTLFSFKNNAVVANSDSATAKWDIGFNSTNIIINGGTSGPGTASAQVVTAAFADVTTAPDAGYLQDNKNASPALYAITRGSGNGWYSYNPSTNIVTPIAGRVIVLKTADGKYAKMEILSYYKDAPATPTSSSVDRYYTFRFIYQSNGSATLK